MLDRDDIAAQGINNGMNRFHNVLAGRAEFAVQGDDIRIYPILIGVVRHDDLYAAQITGLAVDGVQHSLFG